MPALFITATDTNAGKTYCSALLVRALRDLGFDAVGMKPFCSGPRDDAEILAEASEQCEPLNLINPIWFRAPLSPWAASMVEQRPVDLALARDGFDQLCSRHEWVIVEGVGGWLVPLNAQWTVADLVEDWALPVLLVAEDKLGVLNHTLLTLESIRRRPVRFLGTLLNEMPAHADDASRTTNRALLEMWPGTEVLGSITAGANGFPVEALESIRRRIN